MRALDRRYVYLLTLLIVAGAASLDPAAQYGERTGALLTDEEMAPAEMAAWTVDEAEIDVEPATDTPAIDVADEGAVRVAVLTTREFDATDVNRSTVRFEGAPPVQNGPSRGKVTDANGDGDTDVILDFWLDDVELAPGSSEARLVGETLDGTGFESETRIDTAFSHSSNDTEVLLQLEPGSGRPEVSVKSGDTDGSPPGEVVRTVEVETENASYSEARLRLRYDTGALGTPDDEVSLWHLRNATWTPVDAAVRPGKNYVEADVSTLSTFALTEAYHDGFGDGAVSTDWSGRGAGYWYESDGVLVQDSRDTGVLINANATDGLANHTASVEMLKRGEDSRFASLLLRTDGSGDEAVEARLDWSNDTVELGYVDDGVYRPVETLSVPNATGRGVWDEVRYRVDVTLRGDAATVTVTAPSGSVTLNATSDRFDTGHSGVGLKARDGDKGDKNLFDDLVVEPVQGER